jgi:hypothetical protein
MTTDIRELTASEIDVVAGAGRSLFVSSFIGAVGIVYGNTATADAKAYGWNSYSHTSTTTTPWSSSSSSISVS